MELALKPIVLGTVLTVVPPLLSVICDIPSVAQVETIYKIAREYKETQDNMPLCAFYAIMVSLWNLNRLLRPGVRVPGFRPAHLYGNG